MVACGRVVGATGAGVADAGSWVAVGRAGASAWGVVRVGAARGVAVAVARGGVTVAAIVRAGCGDGAGVG